MNPKFYNANGTLTRYAFACGYTESAQSKEKFSYTVHIASPPFETEACTIDANLSLDGCWHVKAFDRLNNKRLVWDCFDTLTEARNAFKNVKKQYQLIGA